MQQKVKVVTLLNQDTKVQDKYALGLNPIGQGKYAKVYKAVNIKDSSKVFAVKVIKIQSEEIKNQYLKELKIIKNLPQCPNLVKTHKQHLQSQNNLYIFQEFCQSGTLVKYRAQKFGGSLSEEQIYDLFYQVTNGLITLLEAGIIHEDIKPVNILKKNNIFKLCDFGVSEVQKQCKETTTRKGTISYMPPEKLKSKKFLPNEKSDIYSLGTCLYEIIFNFHPYLKKKTANYKQYLKMLEQASLRPIPFLMKRIGSISLRLQNFLTFLEKMIDLNHKNRVGIAQLKNFIKTTEPFMHMNPPVELQIQNYHQNLQNDENYKFIHESVVVYRQQNSNQLQVTTLKPLSPLNQHVQSEQSQKSEQKINIDEEKNRFETGFQKMKSQQQMVQPQFHLPQKVIQRFLLQLSLIVDIIGLLKRGVEYIRRSNFNDLNIIRMQQNHLNIDLSDCMKSRYLKYLIYEYVLSLLKKFKSYYQQYLDENTIQRLQKDQSHFNNEFNKFLIETNFKSKETLCNQLKKIETINLWSQISLLLEGYLKNISSVKENNKYILLSIVYCQYMPKLLKIISSFKSLISQKLMQEHFQGSQNDTTELQRARKIFNQISQLQPERVQTIRKQVEQILQALQMPVLYEIQEPSSQIQIIQEDQDFS